MPNNTLSHTHPGWASIVNLDHNTLLLHLLDTPEIAEKCSNTLFHPSGKAELALWLYYKASDMPRQWVYEHTKNLNDDAFSQLKAVLMEAGVSFSTALFMKVGGAIGIVTSMITLMTMARAVTTHEAWKYEKVVMPKMSLLEYALSTLFDYWRQDDILKIIESLVVFGDIEDNINLLQDFCTKLIDSEQHQHFSHIYNDPYIQVRGQWYRLHSSEIGVSAERLAEKRNNLHQALTQIICKAQNNEILQNLPTREKALREEIAKLQSEIACLKATKPKTREAQVQAESNNEEATGLSNENERLHKELAKAQRKLESVKAEKNALIAQLKRENGELKRELARRPVATASNPTSFQGEQRRRRRAEPATTGAAANHGAAAANTATASLNP